ncbi:hypothetical protein LVD13_01930 [Flavobacteriaceae bacterium D16]|nr:hypothetical protein [Flavobacteriaceae bacterium D16]
MRHTIYFIICSIMLLGCAKEKQTQYSLDSEEVFLVITENTTKEELSQITAKFKEKRNIDIDFSKSQFSKEGRILNLDLKVDCNDGFKGTTAGSFKSFRFGNYGFYRNYSSESERAFHIGSM